MKKLLMYFIAICLSFGFVFAEEEEETYYSNRYDEIGIGISIFRSEDMGIPQQSFADIFYNVSGIFKINKYINFLPMMDISFGYGLDDYKRLGASAQGGIMFEAWDDFLGRNVKVRFGFLFGIADLPLIDKDKASNSSILSFKLGMMYKSFGFNFKYTQNFGKDFYLAPIFQWGIFYQIR